MADNTNFTLFILFGSQTGQAQSIAEDLYQEFTDSGICCRLFCLDKFGKEVSKAIFVISTTGDGDPPDNAAKFVRKLKRKTVPKNYLQHLQFALLGLGDTNYNNFCNGGKTLNGVLTRLGAKSFYMPGFADDAVGLEIVVEPWKDGLRPVVKELLRSNLSTNDAVRDDDANLDNKTVNESATENLLVAKEHVLYEPRSVNSEDSDTVKGDYSHVVTTALSSMTIVEANSVVNKVSTKSEKIPQENNELLSQLVRSNKEYSADLMLPSLPIPYLDMQILESNTVINHDVTPENVYGCVSSRTKVIPANIIDARYLTRDDAIKKVLELTICLSTENHIDFVPGDSINIYCPNDEKEVEWLLTRLGLKDVCYHTFDLNVIPNTKKRLASIPGHIPKHCTIKDALLFHCDIRCIPKKAILLMLTEYANNREERRRLYELCSKEGAMEYTSICRQGSFSFLDILAAFPSCHPPFIRIIELLPPLQPRPYSIASSPIRDSNVFKIAFTIVHLPPSVAMKQARIGLCSGWLERITQCMHSPHLVGSEHKLQEITSKLKIPISTRKNQSFHLPNDATIPLIMIAAGTGISPFVGFLEHRWLQNKKIDHIKPFGFTTLFFGCRHKDRDYLYKDEIDKYFQDNILSDRHIAFSRDLPISNETRPCYVQDSIRQHCEGLMKLVFEQSAYIYVCGDAQGMAKEVMSTLTDLIADFKGVPKQESSQIITNLMKEKRYLQDVWA